MTLELRCPDHPTYRAIRKPRVKCEDCEYLWWKALAKRVLDEHKEDLRRLAKS